jgi:hypothetical protein
VRDRHGPGLRRRLAAEGDDLVRQELRVALLVRNFGQEELRELRSVRAGRLRGVREILDDRAELAGEILVLRRSTASCP